MMPRRTAPRLVVLLVLLGLAYGLAMWPPVRSWYAPDDKLAHALVFAAVYAGLAWSLGGRPWALAALAAALGGAVELHQFFLPGFTPSLDDWLADLLGIALAMAVHVWALRQGVVGSAVAADELPPGMLDERTFRAAVKALPLVSVDWVLASPAGELLLGRRLNAPARDTWFTPGGRVRKGEAMTSAQQRVAMEELGLPAERARALVQRATLMGVWDHFYADAAFSPTESTHYVNLPFAARLTEEDVQALRLPVGQQHGHWQWLAPAAALSLVHPHVQPYVQWWVQHGAKTDTH